MRSSRNATALLTRRAAFKGCASAWLAGVGLRFELTHANDLRVGGLAPPASLVTLDGERLSTSELIGQVVILTFWATWCEPCREELPLLSRYADQHAHEGLRVLGVCLDESDNLAAVRRVADTLHFSVGLLANASVPGYGRIWRLPVSFTIDRSGHLVEDGWKLKKPVWTAERLEQVVTPLL